MFTFRMEKIPNIIFQLVTRQVMEDLRDKHINRYNNILHAIPGTSSYHQFIPLRCSEIGAKICSNEDNFACIHDFNWHHIDEENISISSYAAAVYDDNWWIGLVLEKHEDECDETMKFMHPKGPSKYLFSGFNAIIHVYSKSLHTEGYCCPNCIIFCM